MKTSIIVKKQKANSLYNFNHVTVTCPSSKAKSFSFLKLLDEAQLISVTPFGEALDDKKTGYSTFVYRSKNNTQKDNTNLFRHITKIINESTFYKTHFTSVINEAISNTTINAISGFLKLYFANLPTIATSVDDPHFGIQNIIYDTKIDVEESTMLIFAYTTEQATNREKDMLKEIISTLFNELKSRTDIEKVSKIEKDGVYTITINLIEESPITEGRLRELTFEKLNTFLADNCDNNCDEEYVDDESNNDDNNDTEDVDAAAANNINKDIYQTDKGTLILGDVEKEEEEREELLIDDSDELSEDDTIDVTSIDIDSPIKNIVSDREINLCPVIFVDIDGNNIEPARYGVIINALIGESSIFENVFKTMRTRAFISEVEDDIGVLMSDLTEDGSVIIRAPITDKIESASDVYNWLIKLATVLVYAGFDVNIFMDKDDSIDTFERITIDVPSKELSESVENYNISNAYLDGFVLIPVKSLESNKFGVVIKQIIKGDVTFDTAMDLGIQTRKALYKADKAVKFDQSDSTIAASVAVMTMMNLAVFSPPETIQYRSEFRDWVSLLYTELAKQDFNVDLEKDYPIRTVASFTNLDNI